MAKCVWKQMMSTWAKCCEMKLRTLSVPPNFFSPPLSIHLDMYGICTFVRQSLASIWMSAFRSHFEQVMRIARICTMMSNGAQMSNVTETEWKRTLHFSVYAMLRWLAAGCGKISWSMACVSVYWMGCIYTRTIILACVRRSLLTCDSHPETSCVGILLTPNRDIDGWMHLAQFTQQQPYYDGTAAMYVAVKAKEWRSHDIASHRNTFFLNRNCRNAILQLQQNVQCWTECTRTGLIKLDYSLRLYEYWRWILVPDLRVKLIPVWCVEWQSDGAHCEW